MIGLHRFRGSMTALITPFQANGQLDLPAFASLVDWQIREGTQALVPAGTTGEASTLSHDEQRQVIEACVQAADGRVPVIAGAGSNSTQEAIDMARHAQAVGTDAVMVVTPYYNTPTQEGLYQHFKRVAEAVSIPVFIYNIPSRSAVDMMPDTMAALVRDVGNVIGVKDATGRLERVGEQREACGPHFIQLSGEDATALGFNALGGQGCISVTANVTPGLCAAFQRALLASDFAAALKLHERLLPLHQALFIEPGVCGVKYALSTLLPCPNVVRLPLVPVATATQRAIDLAIRRLDLHANPIPGTGVPDQPRC
jgi:4-hydroxy-tetrahydrodipicolinate synthase